MITFCYCKIMLHIIKISVTFRMFIMLVFVLTTGISGIFGFTHEYREYS